MLHRSRTRSLFPPALLAVVAVATLAGAACQAERVRIAPFRMRPDSVEAGSLMGPFDGRVVDSGSGDPVAGAVVYATWTFQSGYGLQAPAGFKDAVTSTDADGRYRIERLGGVPSHDHLTDFHLVIYKRGYVAYRSDRRFEDLGPRLDFAQRHNVVRLERWRSNYSHVRHMRYVGGGPAIAALTRWEADEAAAELSGVKSGPRVASDLIVGATGGVTASQVLTDKDIRAMTGFDGAFETGPLNDEPDTDVYSSQHFRALGQPETFDVAIRVWKLDQAAAETRYRELGESLPQVKQTDEIADKSLRATEQQIFGVAFLDQSRGVVVLITCGQAQCKKIETLVALARKAYERVRQMVPKNAAESPGTAPPASGSPPPGTAQPGEGATSPEGGSAPAGTGAPPQHQPPSGGGESPGDSQ